MLTFYIFPSFLAIILLFSFISKIEFCGFMCSYYSCYKAWSLISRLYLKLAYHQCDENETDRESEQIKFAKKYFLVEAHFQKLIYVEKHVLCRYHVN
jgi:hypothetical protein